jgi:hypothetical protein
MDANFMQCCKINCPVCKQDKDSLTVWRNMDGIAFCACDECIAKMPVFTRQEHAAILKVGFRAGYDKAVNDMKYFLQHGVKS